MPSDSIFLPELIAATSSPRRHAILKSLGVRFLVAPVCIKEVVNDADPVWTVFENAAAKHAAAVAANGDDKWIIAADTIVFFDGKAIGKPADEKEAEAMLLSYRGRRQTVFTAVAMSAPRTMPRLEVAASSVKFRNYSEDDVKYYMSRTNILDRAGAYDINENADMLVESWSGSRTNIMGLPRELLADWLKASGYFTREGG